MSLSKLPTLLIDYKALCIVAFLFLYSSSVTGQAIEEELNWTTFSNKQTAQNDKGEIRENKDYVLVTYEKTSIKFIYPERDDLVIKFPISSKYDGIDDLILYTKEEGITNIRVDSERNVTVYYDDKTIISFEADLYFYWKDQHAADSTIIDLSATEGGKK